MKKLICVLLAWAMLLTAVPTIEAQAATKISKPLITSVAESSGAKVTIKWKKNFGMCWTPAGVAEVKSQNLLNTRISVGTTYVWH